MDKLLRAILLAREKKFKADPLNCGEGVFQVVVLEGKREVATSPPPHDFAKSQALNNNTGPKDQSHS